MKRADQNTIEKIGIPGMVLMERAALQTKFVLQQKGLLENKCDVLILTGMGNNGGDGLALARLLSADGHKVEILSVGDEEKSTESRRLQNEIIKYSRVSRSNKPSSKKYDIVVDALFGVGLSRNLEGDYLDAIKMVNQLEGFKLAMDVPSGICSDTGKVLGDAFRAKLTVTFGFEKRGLKLYPGCEYAGETICVDVGIPREAFFGEEPGMYRLDEDVKDLLPERKKDGNKGTFGKALMIAGSFRMAGAAVLSAGACARIGAGMVKVLTDSENRVIVQECLPEALFGDYETLEESLKWCSCICVGPGLGKSEAARVTLEKVLHGNLDCKPMILDADALNLIAQEESLLKQVCELTKKGCPMIMTPHMGEFQRLLMASFGEKEVPEMKHLKEQAWEYGRKLAEFTGAVIVVKDARTFVCSQGRPICLNDAGNSGMATAGSGDVLAGMITGLVSQGLNAFDSAVRGVRIHGLCGDEAAKRFGEHGLIARDLITSMEQ